MLWEGLPQRVLDGSGLAAGLHCSSWLMGEKERGDVCDGADRPLQQCSVAGDSGK